MCFRAGCLHRFEAPYLIYIRVFLGVFRFVCVCGVLVGFHLFHERVDLSELPRPFYVV